MAFRIRFTHSLMAGLTGLALISGCCANGQCRKIRLPQCHWPQNWARPSWMPSADGPLMPIPADPSGSPYSPQSPRGLYVPSGPAPESKLGLPVPPPLQPAIEDEPPQPESLPPDADDLDVSFQNRSSRRPTVIAPPPPEESQGYAPRVAERVDLHDRHRQPVVLGIPESEFQPSVSAELPRDSSTLRRSPVEAFPQPQQSGDGVGRGTGHTPPFDDTDSEEVDDEPLPEPLNSSGRRTPLSPPESLPELAEPEEDLAFPGGVHRQASADRTSRSNRVERLNSNVTVQNFHLTQDARSGSDAEVISARSLKRGQKVVVRAELLGLTQVPHKEEVITRVTYHCELRDASNRVLFSTKKASSVETVRSPESSRKLLTWLAIPSELKAGKHMLQVHVLDNLSNRTTLIEMPVTVK